MILRFQIKFFREYFVILVGKQFLGARRRGLTDLIISVHLLTELEVIIRGASGQHITHHFAQLTALER